MSALSLHIESTDSMTKTYCTLYPSAGAITTYLLTYDVMRNPCCNLLISFRFRRSAQSTWLGWEKPCCYWVFGFHFYVDPNTKSKFKSDWDRSHLLSQTVLDLTSDLNGEFGWYHESLVDVWTDMRSVNSTYELVNC